MVLVRRCWHGKNDQINGKKNDENSLKWCDKVMRSDLTNWIIFGESRNYVVPSGSGQATNDFFLLSRYILLTRSIECPCIALLRSARSYNWSIHWNRKKNCKSFQTASDEEIQWKQIIGFVRAICGSGACVNGEQYGSFIRAKNFQEIHCWLKCFVVNIRWQ